MTKDNDTRILVVDDEDLIRDIVAFDLERKGYEVVHASGGVAALEVVKKERPALVISDVRMPAGTGTQLLGWIKALNPRSPRFIFMTAFADISSDEALDQGAEAFLTKPLDRDSMLDEVERALVPIAARWAQAVPEDGLRPIVAGGAVTPGSGGFFVPMDDDFPTTLELVAFDFAAEGLEGTLVGQGRVRWVRHERAADRPAGVGIELVHLEETSRQRYLKYLDAGCPVPYVPLGPRRAG
jgi:CheY-like chemotaxis protein